MLIFLYNLLTAYIIPGMMLAFGICLFCLSIPEREKLKNYVFARKVMGATFLVYCVALICEAVTREPFSGDLLNSMIVIAIAVTQAFLFTFSLISLLDTDTITKRLAVRETSFVVTGLVAAFVAFAFCPQGFRLLVFTCFSLVYMMQMTRYVAIFRRYHRRYLQLMDNYFSDDERQRLHWVPVAFYSALGVGIVALLFAWLITPFTQLLFMLSATVYYSVFAVRFINYVDVFPKIKEPLKDHVMEATVGCGEESDVEPGSQTATEEPTADDEALMRQIEQQVRERSLFKAPDLSIAHVAALSGKSHRLVSLAINHCRGVNFKTYINEYRVAEAVRLIEEGWLRQHTLDSLASETGFASRVNLYRAFKRKTGVAPTDWEAREKP